MVITIEKRIDALEILISLWPGDWEIQLDHLNQNIQEQNKAKKWLGRVNNRGKLVKELSPSEFCMYWRIEGSASEQSP